MTIVLIFLLHSTLSVFCQSFFLHRYSAHRMFTMSKGWERFFHLLTYVCQGASYLNPRGYALLHRLHHAYSDTPKDPHSPHHHGNVFTMMWATKGRYDALTSQSEELDRRFRGGYPEWPLIDKLGQNRLVSIAWGVFYFALYYSFATAWWQWLLFPLQCLMGPLHGSIVNWAGHKYGYRNYPEVADGSRNTLFFDFITLGELFQNNHHRFCTSPNFAMKWWEIDPTYQVIKLLALLHIIDIPPVQVPYRNEDDQHLEELNWGIPMSK